MNRKKVSIIGAGNVGASLAQLVAQSGLADVTIQDIVEGVPQGKALDLSQACPLWGSSSSVVGSNDFAPTANSDVIVITAGFPRKPGMLREQLLAANAEVVSGVTKRAAELSPNAIIIVVTNPMDAMAYLSYKTSGFNPSKVIGMGGVLDSARFRTFVAWEFNVAPKDVEALVLGGHGVAMVPMPRFTTVKGIPITELLPKEKIDALIHRTREGGAEIVSLLKTGSAFYAPAAATFEMVKSILLDEKRILPCSAFLNGEYGVKDVYNGVPIVLGKNGVEKVIELKLNEEELKEFQKSAQSVRAVIDELKI
ncbi:MAG: malate dehydrogenase [Thermodesulfovibrionales bacterium]|nr:malate dehydrogenase [Thermodesulfovibrionales bacterium]